MRKKLRNVAGVVGVLSAVSAFFGLRGFVRWLKQQPDFRPGYETRRAPMYTGGSTFSPIPATGPEERYAAAAEPFETHDTPETGRPFYPGSAGPLDSSTTGPTGATPENVPAEIPHTGADAAAPPSIETMAVAMGVDDEVIDTPATAPSQAGEPGSDEYTGETVAGVDAGPLDLPLVEALIAEDDWMAVLRERMAGVGRDPEVTPSSITPVDRMRFQHAADRLSAALDNFDSGAVQPGSPELRAYTIIAKVRDSLSRLEYTDEDLLRIDAEIRAEACEALWSIQHVVDWDKANAAYGCA